MRITKEDFRVLFSFLEVPEDFWRILLLAPAFGGLNRLLFTTSLVSPLPRVCEIVSRLLQNLTREITAA